MSDNYKTIAVRALLFVALSGLALSCKDYEYSSPLPGVLEVHLAVKNTRTSIIPFNDFARFNIVILDFYVDRDDGAHLELLADLHAIKRKKDGDSLNLLSIAARDSQLIWGTTFAPPGTYVNPASGLTAAVTHDPSVMRFDGINFSFIDVVDHFSVPQKITLLNQPAPFEVKEGGTTIVTLTLDLDQSLIRRTEEFEWYAPLVYISSVQYR